VSPSALALISRPLLRLEMLPPTRRVLEHSTNDCRVLVRLQDRGLYNYMKSGQLMRQVVNKINGVDFRTSIPTLALLFSTCWNSGRAMI
jgi:hypothetical protein